MYQRLLIGLIVLPLLSSAQLAIQPRVSPVSIVNVRYKDTYVKIVYSRPQKRGREVLGKLVPYGQVWRTGANEATEITITKDILLDSQKLKAGTYSIFTIPNPTDWTIIINAELGLWGSYNYNEKLDVMRFEVQPEPIIGATYEPFTIVIDQKTDTAIVSLLWDKTKVSFPIQFIETK
ncbi:MAG: DUF2911 domain-containing protein [Cyclobacteriaceae bacterium]|nr:DUF2911 domain-containing protein [Cyclobacteriaceae bacterium]